MSNGALSLCGATLKSFGFKSAVVVDKKQFPKIPHPVHQGKTVFAVYTKLTGSDASTGAEAQHRGKRS